MLRLALNSSHAFSHWTLPPWLVLCPFYRCRAKAQRGQRTYPARHASLESGSTAPLLTMSPPSRSCPFPLQPSALNPAEWALKIDMQSLPQRREPHTGLASESLCSFVVNTHFPSKQKMLDCSVLLREAICGLLKHADDTRRCTEKPHATIQKLMYVNVMKPPCGSNPLPPAPHRAPRKPLRTPGHRSFQPVFSAVTRHSYFTRMGPFCRIATIFLTIT